MTTATTEPLEGITEFDRLFIGGEWVSPAGTEIIESISPITEQVIGRAPAGEAGDIDRAVAAAREAFDNGPWPRMSAAERGEALMRLHAELTSRLPDLAHWFTQEIGAPAGVAHGFLSQTLSVLVDATEIAKTFEFEEERRHEAGDATVLREPIGVVGAITPWNGPIPNGLVKLGPALASGCTVVTKPPPEGVISQMLLSEAIDAAGFPPGVVNVVPGHRPTGEYLVTHPGVDKIAFTGSTVAGRRIGSLCGDLVRPVSLELGGKSGAIITEDADISAIAPILLAACIAHSGQVCAAITRVIVPRTRQDELIDALLTALNDWTLGDPSEPATTLGPVVAERQRDRIEGYIKSGIEEGARLVTGGGRPAEMTRGWYVEPTIFADVDSTMTIAREEIFGPVLCVLPYDDIDDAVRIANATDYGLSGAVFAKEDADAAAIARRIRSGQVGVNNFTVSIAHPFGGYKKSGIGREGGIEGFEEYLTSKALLLPSR